MRHVELLALLGMATACRHTETPEAPAPRLIVASIVGGLFVFDAEPATVAQYRACVTDLNCEARLANGLNGPDVISLPYGQADNYCHWRHWNIPNKLIWQWLSSERPQDFGANVWLGNSSTLYKSYSESEADPRGAQVRCYLTLVPAARGWGVQSDSVW